MWSLWRRVQATHSRPSQLLEVEDSLTAYLLDGAVVTFGTIVENTLQEMVETGSDASKRSKPRWTLGQLLDPTFKLPREGMTPAANHRIVGTSDGGIVVDSI